MKKLFTSLFLLTLIVSLLCPAPVMAETLSFVYASAGNDKYCNGNDTEAGKGAVGGDFQWSGKITDAIEKNGDWIGVNNNVTACSRSTSQLHLAAGNYTFTMDVKWTEGGDRKLPRITITGQSEKNPDMGSSYTFANNETKTLVYTFNGLAAGDYDISVYFEHGERLKQFVQTLVIATSTPVTPTYDVTVNNDGNGTASADKAKYEAGEMVTLTAEPNANYLFDSWTTSDDGFSFADEHSASTTFTMPAKAVTVQANFVECSGQTVTVSVNNGTMGSATGGGSYCAGAQVDLEATPNSGYRFVNWTVTSGSASLDNVNNASTHFTMSDPAAAVTVQANFEVSTCSNTMDIQCEDYKPEISKPSVGHDKPNKYYKNDWNGYGAPDEGYFADFQDSGNDKEIYYNVYLPAGTYTFNLRCSNGGQKKVVLYNAVGDAKLQELNLGSDWGGDPKQWYSYTTDSWTATSAGYYYIGLRAEGQYAAFDKMTITATSDVFCSRTITMAKSGDASAEESTSSVGSAMVGTEITITAGDASDNHYFVNWSASPAVEFADATSETTTFVMPDADVTITANYASYIYTRDISGAGYGTLCLPMAGTVEGATLFSVAGKQEENSKLYVVLQEEPDLVGGQPYIFEKTADELRATMSGVQTPSPATVNGLVGTYVEISPLTPYDESHKNYILALNEDDEAEFQKVGTNVTVGAYRAYINLDGVPAYSPSQAIPGRRYVMMGVSGVEETQAPEDIEDIEDVSGVEAVSDERLEVSGTQKILHNGQLYIIRGGKVYNAQGGRVK